MLVGRSHECDNPEWVRRLPACSAPAFDVSASSCEIDTEVRHLRSGEPLYHIALSHPRELIHELRDLLISQSHCEVCAVTPADLRLRMPRAPGGAIGLVFGGSLPRYTRDRARARSRGARREGYLSRTEALGYSPGKGCAPPPSISGYAGVDGSAFRDGQLGSRTGRNCQRSIAAWGEGQAFGGHPGEQLRDADPEYLIVAPCGFNLQRSLQEQTILERYPWWRELQAVRNRNVAFADVNLFFNRSGMTISETAEIIGQILHGIPFGGGSEGVHWRRIEAFPGGFTLRYPSV